MGGTLQDDLHQKIQALRARGRFKSNESAENAALFAYVEFLKAQLHSRGQAMLFDLGPAGDVEDSRSRWLTEAQVYGAHTTRRQARNAAVDFYLRVHRSEGES